MKVRAVVLALVAMVLVASVPPAAAVTTPPVVGTAKPVTPTQPAGAAQDCPDIAAGNGQFLSVWEDKRHPGNDDIYGQRLDPDGNRLGAPFAISTAAGGQFCPRAAWSGSAWMVVWTDARTGSSDIRGITVTATGGIVPASGFVVSSAASEQRQPSIGFDDTTFVVAWADRRTGPWTIRAARVRSDRTVLDTTGLVVAGGTGGARPANPSVAARNGASVIAWPELCTSCAQATRARVLRTTGFAGPAVLLSRRVGATRSAAGPNLLFVTFRGEPPATAPNSDVRVAQLDPQTGAVRFNRVFGATFGRRDLDALGFDGSRLVVSMGGTNSRGDVVRFVQTKTVGGFSTEPGTDVAQAMLPASVAVLAGGRAALSGMDPATGRLWVVPVT